MSPEKIDIIPALPEYLTVYDMDGTYELGESVIAWRIETYRKKSPEEYFSICLPLTVDGDMASNCIGIQNPDKTVTVFENSTYNTLSDLNKEKNPK